MALALLAAGTVANAAGQLDPQKSNGEAGIILENTRLGLSFDGKTATLVAVRNKLTGETYQVAGDEFAVEAAEFRLNPKDARLTSLQRQEATVKAVYRFEPLVVEVTYALRGENQFAEKRLTLTSDRDYGLKKLILSKPHFSGADLKMFAYRYPKFGRKPGDEPCCTFFGRTPKGGLFTGVEAPFDASSFVGQEVTLAYAPSLKVAAGEKVVCEPVYFGVYRRGPGDVEKKGAAFRQPDHPRPRRGRETEELPVCSSESDAMVAMTSAILGPPRFGLVPMACGWHSEMEHRHLHGAVAGRRHEVAGFPGGVRHRLALRQPSLGRRDGEDERPGGGRQVRARPLGPQVPRTRPEGRRQGRDVAVDEQHPPLVERREAVSGGQAGVADEPGASVTRPEARQVAARQRKGTAWPTRPSSTGWCGSTWKAWPPATTSRGPWTATSSAAAAGSRPSSRWTASRTEHDHLPGDSNYACQRALDQLTASVRKHFPETYIFMCRPPMDLGVWSLRNVDVCFTLLESGTDKEPGRGRSDPHVVAGAGASRFLSALSGPAAAVPEQGRSRPAAATGRARTSTTSCSARFPVRPTSSTTCPPRPASPRPDKAEIRKWLDWGRKNIEYLKVRKDLPDWPAAGKVDGSAHLLGDRGLIFLFNPNKGDLRGEFALTGESIGLTREGSFQVTQEYPPSDRTVAARSGETVRWSVPRESAVVLRLEPAREKH